MLGSDFCFGPCAEDKVLSSLQDTSRQLHGLLLLERGRHAGRPVIELGQAAGHPPGHEDSVSILKKLFWLFKEWSAMRTPRVGFLREQLNATALALRESVHASPERETRAAQVGVSRESNFHKRARITEIVLNVLEDVRSIEEKLLSVAAELDKANFVLSTPKPQRSEVKDETKVEDAAPHISTRSQRSLVLTQTLSEAPCVPQQTESDDVSHITHSDSQDCVPQYATNVAAESFAINKRESGHQKLGELCNKGLNVPVRGQDKAKEKEDVFCGKMNNSRNDIKGNLREDSREVKKETMKEDERGKRMAMSNEVAQGERVGWTESWVTVGLTDPSSPSSEARAVCYLTAPLEITEVVTCKVVDGLSSLMVSGSEELVSSVIRIETSRNTKCPSPLTVAVPFRSSYRGNHREITVKVVDREHKVNYVTPTATENTYGGQRGSFAVVRVYTLGIFAVLSRLQRETFTIPKRGLAIKLSMDSRICLDYLPGSFTTQVVSQAVVQTVDAMLLSSLKCRNDSYHTILATSPLLYLHHPSTLTPRRPLTLTLPCPLNPDKRKIGAGNCHTHPRSTAPSSSSLMPRRGRVLSASLRSSKELSKEQLAVLGWRDEQWNVLDKVAVRNLQNGMVSFELTENYERVIVLHLMSSVRPSYLALFAEELEESVRTCTVTVVLQTKQQDPHSTVLAILPSKELSWGMSDLQAQAYCGPPESFPEISLKEGDQLLLKFGGNITGTGEQVSAPHTVTFHSQRRNWLYLQLKEADPFGNYSSPHYKGTMVLFHIPRENLVWRGDRAAVSGAYCLGEPVCKLPLTLPKTVKMSRPMSAKALQPKQTDPLCDESLSWLCGELSEEQSALLVLCLRLRRSAVQLARLRAPDSLAQQTFHVLTAWRRALPSSTPIRPLLARLLSRIGRPELAAELLRRNLAGTEGQIGGGGGGGIGGGEGGGGGREICRLSSALERRVTAHCIMQNN